MIKQNSLPRVRQELDLEIGSKKIGSNYIHKRKSENLQTI